VPFTEKYSVNFVILQISLITLLKVSLSLYVYMFKVRVYFLQCIKPCRLIYSCITSFLTLTTATELHGVVVVTPYSICLLSDFGTETD
jgi:hypothetical protein